MAWLAYLLEDAPAPRPRFLHRVFSGGAHGLAFGFGANVVALRFVPDVVARFTPLPWILGLVALLLLSLFEGLRWAVASMVSQAAGRRGVPRWVSFPLGVFVASFVPTVFPWTPAGGVTPWPVVAQIAELVGERGLAVTMACVAALLAMALRSRRILLAGIALGLQGLVVVYGAARIPHVDALRDAAPAMKVALVQPGTEARARWDPTQHAAILARLSAYTRAAEAQGAELTVWPEAAYPYPVAHASRRGPIGAMAMLQRGVHGPVLTGLVMSGGPAEFYNSAVLAAPGGVLSEPADKLRLLWFGETVPFADRWPWLRKTFARGVGLVPGDHAVVLTSGEARIAILNCFEDTLPDAGRDAFASADGAGRSANLLVNVTNDAWFVDSQESELHLRLAALRAIELRRDLVRAVNEGVTSWVDATGRVRARLTDTGASFWPSPH